MSDAQHPADSPERESLLGRVVLLVAGTSFESRDPTSDMINLTVNVCGTDIYSLTDSTLTQLCNPALNKHWQATAAKGIYSHWDNQMVSDFLGTANVLQGDAVVIDDMAFNRITGYLKMLPYYDGLAVIGSTERAQQAQALLKFTKHVAAHGTREILDTMTLSVKGEIREHHLPFVNNPRLRDLLIGSDKDREAVLDIVTQRNIFDADHIIAMLDNETRALASGVL